jgi:putative ABC transport system ATP-binding protein
VIAPELALLQCADVHVSLGMSSVLRGVDLDIRGGEVLALTGPSGCGKSTLLNVLAGLIQPQRGSIHFERTQVDALSDAARSKLRLRRFGFVMQFGDLIPELTLRENIELPLRLLRMSAADARQRSARMMNKLDIASVADQLSTEVSGGQAQRAAIGRALVHEPAVVFADEPTGALDEASGGSALEALLGADRLNGAAVLLVTHDMDVAMHADRVVQMRDGTLVHERLLHPRRIATGAPREV